jgi:hypothetical protein
VGVRGREEEVELFLVFLAIIGGFFFLFCPLQLALLRGGKKEERERERKKKRGKKDLERQMGVASEKRRAVIFAAGALLFVV